MTRGMIIFDWEWIGNVNDQSGELILKFNEGDQCIPLPSFKSAHVLTEAIYAEMQIQRDRVIAEASRSAVKAILEIGV